MALFVSSWKIIHFSKGQPFGPSISFDTKGNFFYIVTCAGVVKLVDARDSKSREPQAHVGSIPTSGTNDFDNFSFSVLDFGRVGL